MNIVRRRAWRWIAAGIAGGALLYGVAGWWSPPVSAQTPHAVGGGCSGGSGTTTFTCSTTASEVCSLPGGGTSVVDVCSTPAGCACPAGTAKVATGTTTTVTTTQALGPGTIQTGPCKSQPFFVAAGTTNINTNTETTTTFACVLLPDLAITKTHTGGFTKGGTGQYAITVTNVGAGPTAGTVTVTDTLPTGLTATAMSGTGWTCTLAPLACTRGDVLAAGTSYPPITLTVSIAATAPDSVTNSVTVSGGGDVNAANNTATDPATVAAPAIPTLSALAQALVALVLVVTGLLMLHRWRTAVR
jgi:uncharacterized repeat protein (TIGR01451 family)